MRHRLSLLLPLFLYLISLIPLVYAEGEVNILNIPEYFADKLGIPLFAGQLLTSTIFLFTFLLPIALISRKKNVSPFAELIVGFGIMSFCVALGWMPVWIFVIISLMVALFFSDAITSRF